MKLKHGEDILRAEPGRRGIMLIRVSILLIIMRARKRRERGGEERRGINTEYFKYHC
jgi:hypothetical protein